MTAVLIKLSGFVFEVLFAGIRRSDFCIRPLSFALGALTND
ncbi:hypothetical protein COO91_06439 [Nostoc flagelliforme CCNUN1]|uniref:Uncharacterized protein n=1 Tax=Nostoc flagelliforme CCNUN1 TaxID=2038116 RepID=A0A2K8SYA6_9NOSO|nr:hypothetical protein COO91_06439 [Nostoc flagelliforme CCNUN1]